MSRIRGTDTKPEAEVRSELFRMGFRFRKNDSRYPGKPDIVLPKYRAAIFVHGCFWHGHRNSGCYRLPQTNTEFWRRKIERNRARDQKEIEKLIEDGWRVGVVWECRIRGKNRKAKIYDLAGEISLWLEDHPEEQYHEF